MKVKAIKYFLIILLRDHPFIRMLFHAKDLLFDQFTVPELFYYTITVTNAAASR